MPLPIPPKGNPFNSGNQNHSLPDINFSQEEITEKKKDAPTKRVAKIDAPTAKKITTPSVKENKITKKDDGWRVDEKTGKRYKVLDVMDTSGISEGARMVKEGTPITLEFMKKHHKEVEGFDIENLNATAETFLAHLRVPPNKEEMRQMAEERAQRIREQNAVIAQLSQEQAEKEARELEEVEEKLSKVEERLDKKRRK